jgi:predicted ABC-type ATPase
MLHGGHEVPIKKIVDRYFRSMALARAATETVDRMYLYDNSIDGADAQLVARLRVNSQQGCQLKVYAALPNWAAQIVDGIKQSPEFLIHPSE